MNLALALVVLSVGGLPPGKPRVVVAPFWLPEVTRTRMLREIEALRRCTPMDEQTTCALQRDGSRLHTQRGADGGVEASLSLQDNLDSRLCVEPKGDGRCARDEQFRWGQPPEWTKLEDTDGAGRYNRRTEGALDADRAVLHVVQSALQPDGSWKVTDTRDEDPWKASLSPVVLLAAGDVDSLLLKQRPAPKPTHLELELQKLFRGQPMDIDNDGKPDLFPLGTASQDPGAFVSDVATHTIPVRGFYGDAGRLLVAKSGPYEFDETDDSFLRHRSVTYTQVKDGHFTQRRIEERWPWQDHPRIREEEDPRHDGHWTLIRAWITEKCVLLAH